MNPRTRLALVNLLFLGFILVQVRHLFGNADLVRLTPGLTYAEYARHGFFQLVVVVAIALPMLLVDALPDLPPAMRSEVEARLVKWQSHRTSDWRAWNWGRHRATTVLARAGVGRGDQP